MACTATPAVPVRSGRRQSGEDARHSPLLAVAPASAARGDVEDGHLEDQLRELTTPHAESKPSNGRRVFLLTILIVLTVGDIVLGGIMYDQFGEVYAQFLNIGTAVVYCLLSTTILLLRGRIRPSDVLFCHACCKRLRVQVGSGDTAPHQEQQSGGRRGLSGEQRTPPWYMLAVVGLINGSANWFQSVAQPHTANLTQSLLFLLPVPLVMILSFVLLRDSEAEPVLGSGKRPRKAPTAIAVLGAGLIVVGTILSALRGVINPGSAGSDNGVTTFWYSVCLFVVAQIFLAVEKVFEEGVFARYKEGFGTFDDAMLMFCVTMWTQFALYFPLLPTQTMSALGGLNLEEIPLVMWDGVKCVFGVTSYYPESRALPVCTAQSNTALFFSYAAVDFSCYFSGLYVIQKLDASTNAIASAVALPLQQLFFCLPFLGKWQSKIFGSDFGALGLVLLGFFVHERAVIRSAAEKERAQLSLGTVATPSPTREQVAASAATGTPETQQDKEAQGTPAMEGLEEGSTMSGSGSSAPASASAS